MVNLAPPLLFLLSATAFAAPSPFKDISQGVEPSLNVPETEIQENRTVQASEDVELPTVEGTLSPFETLDAHVYSLIGERVALHERFYVRNLNRLLSNSYELSQQDLVDIEAIKKELSELSELKEFQFYNEDSRLVSYLVEKYRVDRTEIRQTIQEFRKHPQSYDNRLDHFLSKKLSILSQNSISPDRIVLDLNAFRDQMLVQLMDKFQYRGNDDEMERLLEESLAEGLEPKERAELRQDKIREIRRGCSLDEGDNLLVEHMKIFGMDPIRTQEHIRKAREEMLKEGNKILYGLIGYNDDQEMDRKLKSLLFEKANNNVDTCEANFEAISEAVYKAREKIKLEKEKLDVTELAAYDDDQKMSELLKATFKSFDVQITVKQARWRLTLEHAIDCCKPWALRQLIRSGGNYSKSQYKSWMFKIITSSTDQVHIEMLEMILNSSGRPFAKAVPLPFALQRAMEKSEMYLLTFLLTLNEASEAMIKDTYKYAYRNEYHAAKEVFRKCGMVDEQFIKEVAAQA